jgi:polyhydroxyalkanoate synthase
LFLSIVQDQVGEDPSRMKAVLAGLDAYQQAQREPRHDDGRVFAAIEGAGVLDFGPADAPPVLFVPSLINPPYVLDLAPDNSMLRWLAGQGVRPLLVDWGDPRTFSADFSIAAYVEQILLPLIDRLGDVVVAGYCLGGTMAMAAAARRQLRGLALIAAPWTFRGYGDEGQEQLVAQWLAAQPMCEALGLMPMEVLQAGFWRLDPAGTVAKFERFGRLPAGSPKAQIFVALEDWVNEGHPIALAAARELFESFVERDEPGQGEWIVQGEAVDLAAISCPVLNVVSLNDRIVPPETAAEIGTRLSLDAGHVGMVVGSRAPHILWEPLRDWLLQLRNNC